MQSYNLNLKKQNKKKNNNPTTLEISQNCSRVARVNLNKSEELMTNTTAESKTLIQSTYLRGPEFASIQIPSFRPHSNQRTFYLHFL